MAKLPSIPIRMSDYVPDPEYQYVSGIGIVCRPDKLDELIERLNAAPTTRVHVTQNCFEKLNRDAYLKEHGEALLCDMGWMPGE